MFEYFSIAQLVNCFFLEGNLENLSVKIISLPGI